MVYALSGGLDGGAHAMLLIQESDGIIYFLTLMGLVVHLQN